MGIAPNGRSRVVAALLALFLGGVGAQVLPWQNQDGYSLSHILLDIYSRSIRAD